jgi:hypothetical protein
MSSNVNATQLRQLRDALEHSRAELEAKLEALTAPGSPSNAMTLIGTLRMGGPRGKVFSPQGPGRIALRLNQIRAALWRMSSGQYGSYLSCSANIGYRQLRAEPERPVCIACRFRGTPSIGITH